MLRRFAPLWRGDVGLTLSATLANQGLGVVSGILLARSLGPSTRGQLAAIVLWVTFLVLVGSLGVSESVTFHVARRTATPAQLLRTVTLLGLVQASLLVVVGVVLLVPVVFSQIGDGTEGPGALFLANVPFSLLAIYFIGFLNGLRRIAWFNALRVLVVLVSTVGLVGLLVVGKLTLTSAVATYLVASAVTAATGLIVSLRAAGGMAKGSRRIAGRLLGFGWRSQLSTISNAFNERLDQLAISLILPPRQLGLYVVAWTLTSLTGLIGQSLALLALPAVAQCKTDDERMTTARAYTFLTWVVAVAVTAPLLIFIVPMIDLAFGSSFRSAAIAARILLAASVLLAMTRIFEAILKGLNHPLDAGKAEIMGLAITIPGLALLIPLFGITGAAITSIVAYGASALYANARVCRVLDASPAGLLSPPANLWDAFAPAVGSAGLSRSK